MSEIKSIDEILENIQEETHSLFALPEGGYLYLEPELPFIVVYRKKPKDYGTLRLIQSCGSYLILDKEGPAYYQALLYELTNEMSARFNAFLILEIYSGPVSGAEFIIRGPTDKLSATIDTLQSELEKIESRRYNIGLSVKVEHTKERQPGGKDPLLSIDDLKKSGGALLSLEVPPVFKNKQGEFFPVFFRTFRNDFVTAIQKSVYEFTRVQTTSGIESYHALGKSMIKAKVFEIDEALTKIQQSYDFLLLVAPVNIQHIREKFFESNFKEVPDYHYRLLPVDPDLLKRELYNLKIDEIDDPALSYLFEEKREELDKEITMLKERGSEMFFYSSIRQHHIVEPDLLKEAEEILKNIGEVPSDQEGNHIPTDEFMRIVENEFDYFRQQAEDFKCKIHVREDVNVIMVSKGELYLPKDYTLTRKEALALTQHEIGTHALTYFNGSLQSLSQLKVGFADYDSTQEGLAVLSEYLIGGLTGNRLRILAGRVIGGCAVINGSDFKETFHLLYEKHGFSKERAFNITSRLFQGGGFLKDIIYLRGLIHIRKFLVEGGDLKSLLLGKFSVNHIDVINDLRDRGLLVPAKLTPRYFEKEDFTEKINKLRQGLSLSKMI